MQVIPRKGGGFKSVGLHMVTRTYLQTTSATSISFSPQGNIKERKTHGDGLSKERRGLTCWISVLYFAALSLSAMVSSFRTTNLQKVQVVSATNSYNNQSLQWAVEVV
jgi:hypothetical protein